MGKPENQFSTNDGICTPRSIWEPIVKTLGPIQFDPCSHPASTVPALSQVLLPIYWSDPERPAPKDWQDGGDHDFIYADGLYLKWSGVGLTYVNMPYSQLPDVKSRPSWLGKFVSEVDEGVAFFPVRSACEWWQTYTPQLTAITFLAERVTHDNVFWAKDSKDGKHKAGDPMEEGAAFSQALGYVGSRVDLWYPTAAKLGVTWVLDGNARFRQAA